MLYMSTATIWQTDSTSSADTERLGELLGKCLKPGEAIELVSDLGGGKTTLVRGLARGLGSRDIVASPTFVLNKIYRGRSGLKLYHYDFYRLSQPGVVADQLAEALDDPKAIVVIEWGRPVKDVLPAEHWLVRFEPVAADPDHRKITIQYPAARIGVVEVIKTNWQELSN